MAKSNWRNTVVPLDMFEMFSPSGLATIFRFREGDWAGFSFIRPNKTIRKDRDSGGFALGYTVEIEYDDNGDIANEVAETIELKKSEKQGDGTWAVIATEEVPIDVLGDLV